MQRGASPFIWTYASQLLDDYIIVGNLKRTLNDTLLLFQSQNPILVQIVPELKDPVWGVRELVDVFNYLFCGPVIAVDHGHSVLLQDQVPMVISVLGRGFIRIKYRIALFHIQYIPPVDVLIKPSILVHRMRDEVGQILIFLSSDLIVDLKWLASARSRCAHRDTILHPSYGAIRGNLNKNTLITIEHFPF